MTSINAVLFLAALPVSVGVPDRPPDAHQTLSPDNASVRCTLELWGELADESRAPSVSLAGQLIGRITIEGPASLETDFAVLVPVEQGWLKDDVRATPPEPLPEQRVRHRLDFSLSHNNEPGDAELRLESRYRTASASDGWRTVEWKPITVKVPPPPAELVTDLEPERLPEPVDEDNDGLWRIVAASALAAVALTLALIAARRFRRAAPVVSPIERAIGRLDALPSADIDAKAFHATISDVLRHYVAAEFSIPAPRLTTLELAERLDKCALSPERRAEVERILERCDQVKYAGVSATPEQCLELSERVRTWIEETASPGARPASSCYNP